MPIKGTASQRSPWENLTGPNLGYVLDMYEEYLNDPSSVDEELRQLFETWGPPVVEEHAEKVEETAATPTVHEQTVGTDSYETQKDIINKAVEAGRLIRNIRTFGHLAANIDPLDGPPQKEPDILRLEEYDLTEEELKAIPAKLVWKDAHEDVHTAYDAVNRLREIYTNSLGFEFDHVHNLEERRWLLNKVESGELFQPFSKEKKIELLERLTQVERFEHFLHKTFAGQKRFSIEGVDALVPMLDELVVQSVISGARHVMIGMAHRGRLNVLAHVLGKPYQTIFSEFHRAPNKELVPSEGSMGINYGWTGDVKYHLGANRSLTRGKTVAKITLANNPSHLEFVNPVVAGFTRAAQDDRSEPGYPVQDVKKAIAVFVHGDAAFPGEGVVAETLNLSQLQGYKTGGSIHIIANNRIGFTTESYDSRSTLYASDLAKGYEIPIVHVNADDIEACIAAIRLAIEYRNTFNKDFLIDLIGYRRLGHNEMDDPVVTQPLMYQKVRKHPTLRQIWAKQLEEEQIITPEEIKKMIDKCDRNLAKAYEKMKSELTSPISHDHERNPMYNIETGVPLEKLKEINQALLKYPDGFNVYPKLEKILKRRESMLEEGGKVDWALAETLAFATILADGIPIRMSGQDSERGTFAQRHLVLHDYKTGEKYVPLHALPHAKASFAIYNSPLTETAVLGFEYGYDVYATETLVIWEAQFGDFANVAQVIIDQFISAGRAKWGEKSELIMLLPHGYEGQGPEHSSARLERFLQLAAEHNWTIVNLTTAAQYFHILRLQAARIAHEAWRPLIVMSPKSLLRNPRVASEPRLFEEGKFTPILEQRGLGEHPERVERLIFCTGKVAVDLETELESYEDDKDWLHIVRVEQLYPFPKEEIRKVIERYKNIEEIVWVQEEPKNMGSWMYIEPKLRELAPSGVPVRYIGRPERSSPSEGSSEIHNIEQKRILRESLTTKKVKIRTGEGSK